MGTGHSRRVVITGAGIVSPLGLSLDTFWRSLSVNRTGIKPLTRFDRGRFYSRFAAEIREEPVVADSSIAHELKRMDRFVRYALSAAGEALADSGINSTAGDTEAGSIYLGVGMGGLPHMESGVVQQETSGPRRISPYLIPSLIPNMAAGMTAIHHRLRCPQYTVAGSCAGGIQAMELALRGIRSGSIKWALAGGTEAVITPICFSGFEAEGAALFILEELHSAISREASIYAEVSGCASSGGGNHIALQDPGDTVNCLERALADAGLEASAVDCVYAQASGMKKGDEAELEAYRRLFGQDSGQPPVTSIEGHLGHSFAASGPFNLAALLGAIRENNITPTRNFENPEPQFAGMNIVSEPRQVNIRHGLINSAGFGGINAGLIISRYPP
jgi:3-oxoacyl-[acyl-carrier-protein] synthase II